MLVRTNSAKETQSLAKALARCIQPGMVVLLEGNLGSGKTTFTQGFGKALGVQRAIKSPTYTIVKEYALQDREFIHIDAYRLEDGGADSIDLPHYIRHDAIVMIEWAIYLEDYLPKEYLVVRFSLGESECERVIEVEGVGNAYTSLVEQLQMEWSKYNESNE